MATKRRPELPRLGSNNEFFPVFRFMTWSSLTLGHNTNRKLPTTAAPKMPPRAAGQSRRRWPSAAAAASALSAAASSPATPWRSRPPESGIGVCMLTASGPGLPAPLRLELSPTPGAGFGVTVVAASVGAGGNPPGPEVPEANDGCNVVPRRAPVAAEPLRPSPVPPEVAGRGCVDGLATVAAAAGARKPGSTPAPLSSPSGESAETTQEGELLLWHVFMGNLEVVVAAATGSTSLGVVGPMGIVVVDVVVVDVEVVGLWVVVVLTSVVGGRGGGGPNFRRYTSRTPMDQNASVSFSGWFATNSSQVMCSASSGHSRCQVGPPSSPQNVMSKIKRMSTKCCCEHLLGSRLKKEYGVPQL
mmetsp:Transcript_42085/g.117171  ORF Transcript_42085/g.117171 Transcript_42085/m.117171 type:complete len:359 (+) Transcript_42085:408-1484(+)